MSGFAWLPDGSGIVMSSAQGSTLYYLPSFNLSYLYPDVDRTGRLMATRFQLRSDIWRYPVDFGGVENVRRGVRVTRRTGQVRTPTVTYERDPDGKWLALPLVDNGTSNIWAVSTADGTFRQLTDFGRRATFIARRLSWSSDSRSVFGRTWRG